MEYIGTGITRMRREIDEFNLPELNLSMIIILRLFLEGLMAS